MSVFDLDTRGQANLAEAARMSPVLLGDSPAPAFTGMAKGIGMGVMRGGVRVAQLAAMAGGGILSMFERDPNLGPRAVGMYAPGELTNPYFRAVDEYVNNAVDYWTPSPAEVGKAGQILGGLSEIALPLALGGPATLVASQEIGHATDLARQGVDAATAVKAGLIEGAASAVGFKLPFLGRTLASRVATGAVGNLAIGAGGAAAQHGVLDAGGYKDLAAQYAPGDVTARAIDVLTGAAFGGLAHLSMRPADREALLTAANAKHFQNDTAPGHPVDVAASVAHQEALETAIEQTLRGEPVSVPADVVHADFTPRERNASVEGRALAAQDAGIPLEPPREVPAAEPLPSEPATAALTDRLKGDPALRSALTAMKDETGWAQKGGSLMRDAATGEVSGRTTWIPNAEWWKERPKGLKEAQVHAAVDKALAGEKLSPREQRMVEFMAGVHDERVQMEGVHAQIEAAVPAVERQEAGPDADSLLHLATRAAEHDQQATTAVLDTWNDDYPATLTRIHGALQAIIVRGQQAQAESPRHAEAGSGVPAQAPTRGQPEQAKQSASAAVTAAEQAVAQKDFPVSTGQTDAAGHPVTRSARELLAEVDAGIAQAQNDAKGFHAAVACFLGSG